MRESKNLIIDWSKFKSKAKGKNLEKAKNSYMEFCKMLDEVDFELVSDYVGNKDKVELIYKLNNNIKLSMNSNSFKTQTYKTIVNFKNKLVENGDKLIKFIGLTNDGKFVAQIKTFDNGEINIDIVNYDSWNRGRHDFYSKLKEVNGYTKDYYKGKEVYINILIEHIKLNPMSPHNFKIQTYKAIIDFKNKLIKNSDEFIKFVGLTNGSKLIAKIKTFDGGEIDIDMGRYSSFVEARQDVYEYCEEKEYKILSPYIKDKDKILIDFNCGHDPNWIRPNGLKRHQGCPLCSESKGEKAIRKYLENNNIEFIQEHRFEDCRHKRKLPFDFYIKEYNLIVEFDGRQHFEVSDHFGGEESFELTQKRDKIKNKYCKENSINLLRIPYYEMDEIENILNDEFDRLREMKEVC